ncbi:transposase [Streptomyces sp. NPDC058812]|uniref:transposase n=1 Tax=unclassified Streptomyces TaxID=2593676 RepID=UPI003684C9EC
MAGRFARVEARRRAGKFVFALLADLPRKSCWSIAEHAGDADPRGMQHLLNRAVWDTDGVPRRPARARHRRARRHRRGAGGRRDRRSEKRAPRPSGGSASTPAPQIGSRTPRSRSTSPTPAPAGTRARGHAGTRARGHAGTR